MDDKEVSKKYRANWLSFIELVRVTASFSFLISLMGLAVTVVCMALVDIEYIYIIGFWFKWLIVATICMKILGRSDSLTPL
jgi:hypothetical protein